MEWADNVVLDFIRDVQHTPLLWDPKDPCFKLVGRKNEAWQALAHKYKTTVGEVRKKWMSVRASYRREKYRVIERSQTDEEFISTWFAYTAMLFYDERYRPRGTVKRLMREHDPQIPDEEETKDYHVEDDSDEEFEESEQQHTPPPENAFKNTFSQPQRPLKVRKLQRNDDTNFGGSYSHYMNFAPEDRFRDESIIYGEYVGQKLRKFDDRSRAVAIHHINAILFNAEMGQYKNSFLDISGGLQIQTSKNLSSALPVEDGYSNSRGEHQSSASKQSHSNGVQSSHGNSSNGVASEQDSMELKILHYNESYQSE